jgi:hypothetical protein
LGACLYFTRGLRARDENDQLATQPNNQPPPQTNTTRKGVTGDWDSDVLRLSYDSLTTPHSVIDHHIPSGRRATRKVRAVVCLIVGSRLFGQRALGASSQKYALAYNTLPQTTTTHTHTNNKTGAPRPGRLLQGRLCQRALVGAVPRRHARARQPGVPQGPLRPRRRRRPRAAARVRRRASLAVFFNAPLPSFSSVSACAVDTHAHTPELPITITNPTPSNPTTKPNKPTQPNAATAPTSTRTTLISTPRRSACSTAAGPSASRTVSPPPAAVLGGEGGAVHGQKGLALPPATTIKPTNNANQTTQTNQTATIQ